MNAPGGVVAKRYSARAVVVADILRAAGVVPDLAVLRTLAVIHQRNPTLMFEFAAGCLLALTMDEASAAEGGHA